MNPDTQKKISDIVIDVQARYVPEQSQPEAQHYLFSYTIRVTNNGPITAQLLSRHWIISDGWGRQEEVKGSGVIGQQPKIRPGETFEYSSFCPLTTPTGNMRGSFAMMNQKGKRFEVRIPLFFLRDLSLMH